MEKIVIDHQYELTAVIKRGGFGTIYRGYDQVLKRQVAVKEILPHLALEKQYLTMLHDEAVTVARLQHPTISQIYDLRRSGEDNLYIIMEYVDGTDLKQLIRNTPLDGDTALAIIGQVAEALQYAHTWTDPATGTPMPIIHRDISPGNIMVTRRGEVKLIDFGIAKHEFRDQDLTRTGMLKGKLSYMSPEQITGKPVPDGRTDIFSCGVVLYEAVTGSVLFPEQVSDYSLMKTIESVDVDLPALLRGGGVGGAAARVIEKCVQQKPGARYTDARELARDCQQGITGTALEMKDTLAKLVTDAPAKPAEPPADKTATVAREIVTKTLMMPGQPGKQPDRKKKRQDISPRQQALVGAVFLLASGLVASDITFGWPGIWFALTGKKEEAVKQAQVRQAVPVAAVPESTPVVPEKDTTVVQPVKQALSRKKTVRPKKTVRKKKPAIIMTTAFISVKDADFNPLRSVTVRSGSRQLGATDHTGTLQVRLPIGKTVFSITEKGYKPFSSTVELKDGENRFTFILQP